MAQKKGLYDTKQLPSGEQGGETDETVGDTGKPNTQAIW